MHIVAASTQSIGADVLDVDVKNLRQEQFDEIYAAWLQYAVLRIRNQKIDDDQLKDFSQRFGALEYAPLGFISEADRAKVPNPYVAVISNIIENGQPIGGLGYGETSWHTDMSYIEKPPTASLLYAVEVPSSGGSTSYCCMRKALETLPETLRLQLRNIRIKHDAAHDSIGKLRRGHKPFQSPKEAPGAIHPAIRQHQETGEEALFLGRRQNAYIDGFDLEESEKLLDEIWQYVAKPEHIWTQDWQQGDLVVWDNRVVMHQRGAFSAEDRRLMRRTQVKESIHEQLAA